MAAGDYSGKGTGTIPKSGPGVISSVDITVTGAGATDVVTVNFQSDIPRDAFGTFQFKAVPSTNKVTITANRAQLPTNVSVDVMTFATA